MNSKEGDQTAKELGDKIDRKMRKISALKDKKMAAIIVMGIFLCFCLIFLAIATYGAIDMNRSLLSLRKELLILQKVSNRQEEHLERTNDYAFIKADLHMANEKFKALQDLDRICIQSYIKGRYSKTPTILAEAIAKSVVELSRKHRVPIPLIVGVMETESTFNPYLKSTTNARGLMQVRFKVWGTELSIANVSDLHEIDKGIEYGILVLKRYLEESDNNLKKALWKYNGKGADHNKYASKVFTNVGRYILYKFYVTYSVEDFDL